MKKFLILFLLVLCGCEDPGEAYRHPILMYGDSAAYVERCEPLYNRARTVTDSLIIDTSRPNARGDTCSEIFRAMTLNSNEK